MGIFRRAFWRQRRRPFVYSVTPSGGLGADDQTYGFPQDYWPGYYWPEYWPDYGTAEPPAGNIVILWHQLTQQGIS